MVLNFVEECLFDSVEPSTTPEDRRQSGLEAEDWPSGDNGDDAAGMRRRIGGAFLKNPANLLMHEERVPDVESVGVEFEESKQGFDTHPQQSFED